jgi:type VI secretion system secreted protein Hcp
MLKHACLFVFLLTATAVGAQDIGSIEVAGRNKYSGSIQGFSMSMETPTDATSGLATGKRKHDPIIIHKEVDAGSNIFYSAVTSNEVFKTVKIVLKNKVTITLTNAIVSKLTLVDGTANANMKVQDAVALDEISFTYQKIEITWENSKTSFNDDWNAR